MQFITNGPDIPNSLLQAHEEGRVVFFCGAGISYPAGLPGFSGLVKRIYELNGTNLTDIERQAFEQNQFDATLDLLERRLPGQRLAVRRALTRALKPNLRLKKAVSTHTALLQLSQTRAGSLRLVTTNFDRLFEVAAKRLKTSIPSYSAPMLPIPKNSRWNGLVYLHGKLPRDGDETSLHRLVITSGDFGLAYLTERWAARFVSELFRNYVVCFVGYSINDPVMRYMMDALAADRMLGEVTPGAWAFGDCLPGQEQSKTIEWEAKGVTPILYAVPPETHDHSALHETLQAWAEIHRDGVLGKERIVINHALTRPSASTQQDDFVGRMLWALSDKSGIPAKIFAEFNPAPKLEWLLDSFSTTRFAHADLAQFSVTPSEEEDNKLTFSFIRRPAQYSLSHPMSLASIGSTSSRWDDVMLHIARWVLRHLDDPRLLLWIVKQGGTLDDRLALMLDQELHRLAVLEEQGKQTELTEIRLHAPNAIPGKLMSSLWRLLLSGRIQNPSLDRDLYQWKTAFKRDGLTVPLRLELRNLLAPKLALRKAFSLTGEGEDIDGTSRLGQVLNWEFVLSTGHVKNAIADFPIEDWNRSLPFLVDDFQQLLRDALDLQMMLGEARERHDRSHWDLPSIKPHWQNRGFRDWSSLIELSRDAWLEVYKIDRSRAAKIADNWFQIPFPTFKRLALFAASHDNCVPSSEWVSWLLIDNSYWLWAVETQREVCRLLIQQSPSLDPTLLDRLVEAILAGAPREMFVSTMSERSRIDLCNQSVWLYLSKLKAANVDIGPIGTSRLEDLSTTNPSWKLASDERDEFSHWISGSGDPDYDLGTHVEIAPRKRSELALWLKKSTPQFHYGYLDNWQEVCRTRFFHSFSALCDLAKNDCWPIARWREALQTWSHEDLISRSWKFIAPLLRSMPLPVLEEIVHSAAMWLGTVAKSSDLHRDIFLDLSEKILTMSYPIGAGMTLNGESVDEPVTEAINHPVGQITLALISLWFRSKPNDNENLPSDIKEIFTDLCSAKFAEFKHARVILASQAIALFRVDRSWTETNLLPFFSWENSPEAKASWEGFLWSPRLYLPLLIVLKPQLLKCSEHYFELGEHRRQFAAFLTYLALGPIDGYQVEELRVAFATLPQEGLEESAEALYQALDGARESKEEYWNHRVLPLWRNLWPKSRKLASSRLSESLARLCIVGKKLFPDVIAEVGDWLKPLDHPDYVITLLHDSQLCREFPDSALLLLNLVIKQPKWIPPDLKKCLESISAAAPRLSRDPRFIHLGELARR